MTNIYLESACFNYWFCNNSRHYGIYDKSKFASLFLPFYDVNDVVCLNNSENNKKIVMTDCQGGDSSGYIMNNKNVNILLSIENFNYWKHYKHYNKYGNYGNDKINIYLYNHINKLKITDSYIVIPVIYLFINYYKKYHNIIKPTIITPFDNKLFCLIVSFSKRNERDVIELNILINKIKNIDHCDTIKNIEIKGSAYFTTNLLNIFNRYKFIICFENSITDGYITEKPFNSIFAHSIPIYYGPLDTCRYFNKDRIIDVRQSDTESILNKITSIKNDKVLFNNYINRNFINKDFDDENFLEQTQKFIKHNNLL